MRRRRCLNGISPYRARSAAATGGSAPGSIACARASLACSIANSIAGAEAADRLRLLRSEEHTSELQPQSNLVCRLLLEKKKKFRQPPLVYRASTGLIFYLRHLL